MMINNPEITNAAPMSKPGSNARPVLVSRPMASGRLGMTATVDSTVVRVACCGATCECSCADVATDCWVWATSLGDEAAHDEVAPVCTHEARMTSGDDVIRVPSCCCNNTIAII